MQVMRLLVSQQIDHKTASLLLYALQTASTNLRLTNFKPFIHEVILDPRDVANTPLDSHIWDDEDFEDEADEEEETDADRAIAALEATRKKKEEEAKWMKWAEAQYPKPQPTTPSATVTATGSAAVAPATPPKKPAASLDPKEIRKQISEQIRKEFLPGYSSPGGSKSTGERRLRSAV
jgi:chemotaxis protein histidine kinase CheA